MISWCSYVSWQMKADKRPDIQTWPTSCSKCAHTIILYWGNFHSQQLPPPLTVNMHSRKSTINLIQRPPVKILSGYGYITDSSKMLQLCFFLLCGEKFPPPTFFSFVFLGIKRPTYALIKSSVVQTWNQLFLRNVKVFIVYEFCYNNFKGTKEDFLQET